MLVLLLIFAAYRIWNVAETENAMNMSAPSDANPDNIILPAAASNATSTSTLLPVVSDRQNEPILEKANSAAKEPKDKGADVAGDGDSATKNGDAKSNPESASKDDTAAEPSEKTTEGSQGTSRGLSDTTGVTPEHEKPTDTNSSRLRIR